MGLMSDKRLTAPQLIELLEELDLEPQPYSGRGMYGAHCVGVVTDDPLDLLAIILIGGAERFTREHPDLTGYNLIDMMGNLYEQLAHPYRDSMGLSVVLYWPKLTWTDDAPESTLLLERATLATSVTGDPEVVDVDLHHG